MRYVELRSIKIPSTTTYYYVEYVVSLLKFSEEVGTIIDIVIPFSFTTTIDYLVCGISLMSKKRKMFTKVLISINNNVVYSVVCQHCWNGTEGFSLARLRPFISTHSCGE